MKVQHCVHCKEESEGERANCASELAAPVQQVVAAAVPVERKRGEKKKRRKDSAKERKREPL